MSNPGVKFIECRLCGTTPAGFEDSYDLCMDCWRARKEGHDAALTAAVEAARLEERAGWLRFAETIRKRYNEDESAFDEGACHMLDILCDFLDAPNPDEADAEPVAEIAGQTEPGQRAATVAEITKAVRQADEDFRHVGGSSRHWVRDCFIPALDAAWMRVVVNPPARSVACKECAG